jgi:hypothetical protein
MKKLLTLLLLSPLAFAENISEYQRITPIELKIQNNLERTILDYSTSDELGVNQQLAPVDWTGPIVSLEFELRGVVIAGILGLEFKEETAKFNVNEGFVIPKNTRFRNHNAGNVPLHFVEILRPGYKESLVKEYESFK